MVIEEQELSKTFRCGYVAIMGEPNVGKSTLMNGLLQQKISVVTPKPQTTRHKVLGILSTQEYQIIFLDTPGIIDPRYMLQKVMLQAALSAMNDADILLVMIDATDPGTGTDFSHAKPFARLREMQKTVFLVINKTDAVPKENVLPIIDSYSKAFPFHEIFPISALKLEGTAEMMKSVVRDLPRHPPLYPLDVMSGQNERFFVSEIIREKIFLKYREEIPYATAVEIVEFKDREGGKTFISADVYVERDSQKGILIGKKGSTLKKIGLGARKDIEVLLQRPVFLELHVKVQRKWREDEKWLARLGYSS